MTSQNFSSPCIPGGQNLGNGTQEGNNSATLSHPFTDIQDCTNWLPQVQEFYNEPMMQLIRKM